jgi:DNA-binding NarL/FixJ family response regulator
MKRVRIVCVDDHAFVAEGLQARLAKEHDLEVVAHLDRADRLVEAVRRTGAEIVLMDIEMSGLDPFTALEDLARHCPDARAILLTAYVRDRYLDAAFRAGAWGYLTKKDPPETVIEGIREVVRGGTAFSPDVLERTADERERTTSRLDLLTPKEHEILRFIARGLSRTQIARQLSRSPMTVDNHRKSIMRKLGIHDRAELVRYAIAEKLVEP